MTIFGAPLRELFLLKPGAVFLNHGSFGATPGPVRAAQARWRDEVEAQPDVFFRETIWAATRTAAARVGALMGAPGESLAFVPNVTEAVAVVLDAMRFKAGDEIVLLDVAYAAVRRAADTVAARTGAVARTIPTALQMTAEGYEEGLSAALTARTKLVILDHIVSPTAQLVPVERLIPLAKAAGARVFIDGAHALGQLPLDVPALGADWYATNAHKWLFTPRGCCLLYAAPEVQAATRPVVVSHYHADPFPRCFDYVGTRDVTSYLTAAEGAAFLEGLGFEAVTAHRAGLLAAANEALRPFGAIPVTTPAPALAAWILPQSRATVPEDGLLLLNAMWREAGVQIASSGTTGRLLLRFSLQVYNDADDIGRAVAALDRLGWPGR